MVKPLPYRRRKIRFGWDRTAVIIPPVIGETVMTPVSSSGWTGTFANVNDLQKSGVEGVDLTPETYDGIYCANGTTAPLTLGFGTHIVHQERMRIGFGVSSCQNGVVAPLAISTSFDLEIRHPGTSAIWRRNIATPRNGFLTAIGYDFDESQFSLSGLNVDEATVKFTPHGLGGAIPSGIYLSYFHFVFTPPGV